MAQQALQVTSTVSKRADQIRFLIRDHDRKVTSGCDGVLEAETIRIVRTSTTRGESGRDRFVRTIRSECLDWLLILDVRHLQRVATVSLNITTDIGRTEP